MPLLKHFALGFGLQVEEQLVPLKMTDKLPCYSEAVLGLH